MEPNLPYDPEKAVAILSERDPRLGVLISVVGDFNLHFRPTQDLFEALCQAIVHQQLSGKAAGTIYKRFLELLGPVGKARPELVLNLDPDRMRGVGLSRAKTAAILDLAENCLSGTIPDGEAISELPDKEILERLTSVRGIGTWTVEMLLIFRIGRPDVLPATDLGVRKGFTRLYGHADLVTPAQLTEYGERWKPYRSVASWYLWRILELEEDALPPP